jgi:hypothetical protein
MHHCRCMNIRPSRLLVWRAPDRWRCGLLTTVRRAVLPVDPHCSRIKAVTVSDWTFYAPTRHHARQMKIYTIFGDELHRSDASFGSLG